MLEVNFTSLTQLIYEAAHLFYCSFELWKGKYPTPGIQLLQCVQISSDFCVNQIKISDSVDGFLWKLTSFQVKKSLSKYFTKSSCLTVFPWEIIQQALGHELNSNWLLLQWWKLIHMFERKMALCSIWSDLIHFPAAMPRTWLLL